ncbi:MAG: glycerophosphodiester phosphodiesterase family protein [Jatrophihabitantaceae bacterium]
MSRPTGLPLGYAHRGFSAPDTDSAENTMAAFDAAVQLGFRYLETDARASADGVAVAFHDLVLDRLTNHTGPVAARDWAQLSQARIYGRHPIATLADVLGGFGEVHVNIDVKADAAIGPTLDAIRRTRSWHRVRLAAFSHRRLLTLRRAAGPSVATALSPPEVAVLAARAGRLPALRRLAAAGKLPAAGAAAQVPVRIGAVPVITPRFVELAQAAGIAVHAWTINRPAEMVRLLDLGVDAIITDRADLLREVLRERGQWPS